MMPPDTQSPIQAWYMMTDFMHRLTDVDVVEGEFPTYMCSCEVLRVGCEIEVTEVATTWLSITILTPSLGDQENMIFTYVFNWILSRPTLANQE